MRRSVPPCQHNTDGDDEVNKHIGFKISRKELAAAALLCGCAFWATNVFQQISYKLLPNPGIATILHFTYPLFVLLAMIVFFKEQITISKFLCVAVASVGIVLITNMSGTTSQSNLLFVGALAAVASGATYAVYIISNEKSPAMTVHPLLFTFYVLLGGALFNIIYLNFTHDIYIDFRGNNFFYCIALPLCSFFGLVTIADGIRRIGPTRAAVINMMEPVMSMIVSCVVFRDEPLTTQMVLGGALILLGTGGIALLNHTAKNHSITEIVK